VAHLAHYKRSGAAPMLAHYERRAELERGFTRENIDAGRTAQNYAIGAASPQELAAALRARVDGAVREHERSAGRAVRRDANVLSDWVVTLPRDCPPEDARRFFETAVDVCRARYGAENVLGGFVHMDETTPHVHIPVVPVRDGRLRSARVFTRTDLQRFHKDLGRAEDAALGRHVSVELGPERQGEKQLSHLGQAEYVAAREEAARATERAAAAEDARRAAEDARRVAEDRLECLQRGVEDAESLAAAGLGEVRRVAREGQYVGGRESAAQAENRELRARVEALEGERRELGERVAALEGEKASSPAAIQDLERDVRRLGGRVRELRRERCELAGRVRELERDRDGLAGRVAGLRDHVRAAWDGLVTQARAFRGWLHVPRELEWVCRDLADCVEGFRRAGACWGSDGRAPRRSRGIAR
jgi:hypothetical protein